MTIPAKILKCKKSDTYNAAINGVSISTVYKIKNTVDTKFKGKWNRPICKWTGEVIWLFEKGGNNTDKSIAEKLHLNTKTVSAIIRKYLAEKFVKKFNLN